jgi:cytochrome c biogenesis protein CcdA
LNATISAFFFYGDGCSHCENVKPLLLDLSAKYPQLDIRMLEVYHNITNQETFAVISRQYGISNAGIPALFIGTTAMVGDADIKNRFEATILVERERIASCTSTTPETITVPDPTCAPSTLQLTIPMVVASALIDSINPCAFSVLIFLLISIVSLDNRRRIFMVGGVYIAAVFIFYLLSGFGLFTVVSLSGFSQVLSLIGATIAVILGVISVLDVLRKQEEFLLAIPFSKKEKIERYISTASLPAAFALGIFVGIFELPCTGGIYLAILGLMSRNYTLMEGLPYLILYNFIFVLPLILILVLVAYGVSPEKANEWRMRHRRTLRLIVGLAMIAIGVIIFSRWTG